jgi:hypothetical protein
MKKQGLESGIFEIATPARSNSRSTQLPESSSNGSKQLEERKTFSKRQMVKQ